MSKRKIDLTRRKVVGGLGAIGAAAGLGAGATVALLSDTEQSTDNTLSMGTLNLQTEGNESATTTLDVADIGTGASGRAATTVNNVGSLDGFLNFDVDEIRNLENGINEPESDAALENGGPPGELSQYVTLQLGYDDNGNGNFNAGEVVVDGALDGMENVQFNPNVPIPASSSTEFFVDWEIDPEAGNEVQSDAVEIDFTFELLERERGGDVVLTGDTPYGQGAGFAEPWETSTSLAHSGSGSWGTTSGTGGKHGFYFAGDFSAVSTLSGYTVSDIAEISYWLYEPTALEGVDIYLNIYTRPEGDGDDAGSFYDSRLQALPSEANRGSPNFTPGEWNKFTTQTGATNTLVWSDTGSGGPAPRGGNFNQDLPTLDNIRSGAIDWSNWGANLSLTHDYRDEEILALSLQTGSASGASLEAFIDDVRVELTNGDTLTIDLEP